MSAPISGNGPELPCGLCRPMSGVELKAEEVEAAFQDRS
jgi:hypothetical protein